MNLLDYYSISIFIPVLIILFVKFNHLICEDLFSFFNLYNFTIASQSVLIVISFLEIINILKLSIAYVVANNFASMLLILPFSLYFLLLYLQIFFVFLVEYLWGFTNNTAPHPRLHPSVSIIK